MTIISDLLIHFSLVLVLVHIFLLYLVNAFAKVVSLSLNSVIADADRQSELLADILGSIVTSPVYMMNALIRLGQRIEAVTTLMEVLASMEGMRHKEFSKVESTKMLQMVRSFPLDEIDEFKAAISGPLIYLSTELKNLRDTFLVPLTDEQILDLSKNAVQNMLESDILPTKKLKVLDRSKVISKNWRDFDYNQDQILDPKELEDYIALLVKNPDKFIFTSEISNLNFLNDHPNIRDRIITVYNWSKSQN